MQAWPRRDLSPRRLFEILCCLEPAPEKHARRCCAPRWWRCSLALPAPAAAPTSPRRARSTRTARPGATCSTARGTGARTRATAASRRASSERARSPAGGPSTVPDAANAGDMSARSYLGGVHWYRKDFEAPAGAGDQLGAALRVGQLPRDGVAQRPPPRAPHGRLPAVRARGQGRAAAARTGSSCASTAAAPRRRSRRSACATDGKYVGGWWNYAGILREVYLRRVDTFDFVNVFARPRLDCPTCDARIYVRAVVANMERVPGPRRGDAPRSAGSGSTSRPRRSRRAASTCSAAAPASPRPGSGAPRTRTSTRSSCEVSLRRPGRAAIHAAHRDPQHRARRARPDAPERPAPARCAARACTRRIPCAAPRCAPTTSARTSRLLRELGANMTRSHYPMHPLALELADRYGIVVWSEVPVYQMRDQLFRSAARARAQRAAGPRHGEPRPQPPVGDRLEPRQREHLEAGPRASRAT